MWINIREQCQPEEAYNDATQQAEGCYRALTTKCQMCKVCFTCNKCQYDLNKHFGKDYLILDMGVCLDYMYKAEF